MSNLATKDSQTSKASGASDQPSALPPPHLDASSCKEVTQQSGSNFSIAFRFLPNKINDLERIYAFSRIIDDCVDEPELKQDKINAIGFWKQELNYLYDGKPLHPIMQELNQTVKRYRIPKGYLFGLIKGCEMDIDKNRYETLEELYSYCYHVAGLVGLSCLKVFEYNSLTSENMAMELGYAFQLTNIIRDVSGDLDLNRIYIPQELLRQYKYSESDLLNKKETPAFKNLMYYLSTLALKHYENAEKEFEKDSQNKLRAARAMTLVYKRILMKMIKQGFPVLHKKVSLNRFEKLFTLFRLWFR
jgi:15-cis-phytoene synthase